MRVVVDARTATMHFPGIGRYVLSLANALARMPEVDLLVLRSQTALLDSLQLGRAEVIRCDVSPFSLAQQWRVPQALKPYHADLYHSPYYLMPYRAGIPAVVTGQDVIPLLYPDYFTTIQRLIFRLSHGLALRSSTAVLTLSEATRRDLVRHFHVDPSRVTVTPAAASPAFVPQPAEVVARVQVSYGLPDHYLLYVGSNKPHKNLRRLIEAWAGLLAVLCNKQRVALAIAGPWDTRYEEVREVVKAFGVAGEVRFLGQVAEADLPALYSGAAAFVFPSLYEGFGLPVLEAMACGTPVICSGAASLPEVAGDAALLVDPQDVQAITDAMARVLDDASLREDLCARGLARAGQFSWQRTAQLTLAAYQAAAARPVGRK